MRHSTQPADIATLAWVVPGQEVVIAAILAGAGPECARLRPGATFLCQDVTDSEVVIRGATGHPMHIPLDQADCVQIQRIQAPYQKGVRHESTHGFVIAESTLEMQ